jgi:hypothetical protein
MKKRTPFTVLLGLGLIGACATTESESDLCNPRDTSCRLNSLIIAGDGDPSMDAGVAGNATGNAGDGGMSGGGSASGGAGTSNNGGAGTSNGGDGGDDTGGMPNGGGGTANAGAGAGGGGAGGGGSGGGGAGGGGSGGGGTGGTGGTPECTPANAATACNDSNNACTDDTCNASGQCVHTNNSAPCTSDGNPCTDDVCSGGACMNMNNTASCTGDFNLCTDDVCANGACTNVAGTCGGMVKIQTNRSGAGYYIALDTANGNQLVWSATTLATAETFELITTGTADQFKIRATSVDKFVVLAPGVSMDDDFLLANGADQAAGSTFNVALCAATNAIDSNCDPNCRGIEVVEDNSSKWVSADEQGIAAPNKLRARSGDCGNTGSTWESWIFVEQ